MIDWIVPQDEVSTDDVVHPSHRAFQCCGGAFQRLDVNRAIAQGQPRRCDAIFRHLVDHWVRAGQPCEQQLRYKPVSVAATATVSEPSACVGGVI